MVSDKTQSATEYVTDEIKTSPDDPYSYVVKEEYDRTLEFYAKHPEMEFKSNDYYFTYDINDDGTDELLIGSLWVVGGIDNVEPPYEYKIMIDEIYTVKNGKAVKLSIMNGWDEMFIFERGILDNGLIRYISVFEEEYDYFYLNSDNGEMTFQELSLDDGKYVYRYLDSERIKEINSNKTGIYLEDELYQKAEEKEITAEEFERLRAEIEGDAKPVEIKWKNIDEYGR